MIQSIVACNNQFISVIGKNTEWYQMYGQI